MGQEERAKVEPEMPVALVKPGLLLPWVSLLIDSSSVAPLSSSLKGSPEANLVYGKFTVDLGGNNTLTKVPQGCY